MSKKHKTETTIDNSQGKTVEELKGVAQTLQAQLTEHKKQANHHQTMSVKAQGALEVVLQLIPKEEVEKMVAEDNKELEENNEN